MQRPVSSSSTAGALLAAPILLALIASINADPVVQSNEQTLAKCCQVGKTKAAESQKFNCKMSARTALVTHGRLSAASVDSLLKSDETLGDQCEMILDSCCMAQHRARNCEAGKQYAKTGNVCMDVGLSKEVAFAVESFNDCCMSCSLGILAARNPPANETSTTSNGNVNKPPSRLPQVVKQTQLAHRCKLSTTIATSFSGLLYERAYVECCEQNLPRPPLSSLVTDPTTPIECQQANRCTQKCVPADTTAAASDASQSSRLSRRLDATLDGRVDHCDCFAGYNLAPDGFNCQDIDECDAQTHTCNLKTEICDNTRGGFRCLARQNFGHSLPSSVMSTSSSSSSSSNKAATNDAWPFFGLTQT